MSTYDALLSSSALSSHVSHGSIRRLSFLQPGAGDEAARSGSHSRDFRRDIRHAPRLGQETRQIHRQVQRHARIYRQQALGKR